MRDELLINYYKRGFEDSLYSTKFDFSSYRINSIFQRAYDLGQSDAIAGDDVPSADLKNNEEILKEIREIKN